MAVPYTKTIETTVASGQENCIELPAPYRGIITRLVVKDKSGTDGFSFNVYDREDACSSVVESSYWNDNELEVDFENALLDPELHQIQATQTVTAGSSTSEQFNIILPYENKDESGLHGRKTTALWMSVTPAGAGNKTFQIAYTVTSDSLR